ncbi:MULTISPECIES: methyl-accepting chemotaxis protein [Vibrio]|jgi:methyl-accepting chemotaxis protein|uniref:methyl-accepting chemotaxis protein n=1 Tax=Vibrio TaxID=662 RepID=UPI000BFFD341|nr:MULTISPECIES: methyl-accepting chemotaxis protein [unclassified Vibrio]PHJ40131.1 chemotaxis protein [Vibrio sp. PID17_43]RIZ50545.1 chemotaxis protein [Vibrio sp. PID23_8]
MKLEKQAYLLSAIILIALIALTLSGLWTLRYASDLDNKARITEHFRSAYSMLTTVEKMANEGKLSTEDAKSFAMQLMQNNIYKDNEYVYVADENMDFVAAPLDPQLHGTSFHDFKDGSGQSVAQILLNATAKNPNGIAEYHWTSKGPDGDIVDIVSIAQKTPTWGWVVGTGINSNEVDQRFWLTAQWQLALCILIAAGIFTILIIAIRRMLALLGGEPQEVRNAIQDVVHGNIKTDFAKMPVRGSIYEAVQDMNFSLAELIEKMETSMHALREELQAVETRTETIVDLTASQQQSTAMIATAMTEMASSASNVADSANETAHNTEQADQQSQQTQQLINSTVDNIEGLAAQLTTASQVVSALDKDVNAIVKVLDVIGDIAEQTNLLALNAAIEAARAGEQGRGFAVVADEVRNLAGRTQASTKEIQEMIINLQTGSRNAIQTMELCAATSQSTVEESRTASQALEQIVHALESISLMSQQIASASGEQTDVSNDIAHRINLIEESSTQLNDVVAQSQTSTLGLSRLADQLGSWVNKFTIRR